MAPPRVALLQEARARTQPDDDIVCVLYCPRPACGIRWFAASPDPTTWRCPWPWCRSRARLHMIHAGPWTWRGCLDDAGTSRERGGPGCWTYDPTTPNNAHLLWRAS